MSTSNRTIVHSYSSVLSQTLFLTERKKKNLKKNFSDGLPRVAIAPPKVQFLGKHQGSSHHREKIFDVGSSYIRQTMRLVVYFAAHIHIVAENITNIFYSSKHERPPPLLRFLETPSLHVGFLLFKKIGQNVTDPKLCVEMITR